MTPGLVAELERAELRAWSDFYSAAPSPAVVACGLGMQEYGTAVAFRMSKRNGLRLVCILAAKCPVIDSLRYPDAPPLIHIDIRRLEKHR